MASFKDDNPEWTEADFARARPAMEVFDELGIKRPVGRPKAESPKLRVTMRLDQDIVDRLKADGPGWQTRANAALRQALDLGSATE